jgi:hypothetical protein
MQPIIEGASKEFLAALLAEVQERIPVTEDQLRRLYELEENFSQQLADC